MYLPILTRTEVEPRIAATRTEVFRLGVRSVPLFGSVHRNVARSVNDVDVRVEDAPGQKILDHLRALGEPLEVALEHRIIGGATKQVPSDLRVIHPEVA